MSTGANAGQGMARGAQLGGQVGGSWGAAIGGTVGFLTGLFGGDPNRHAKRAQEKYNAEVVKHTITSLFDRERAQQVERMRTARALQSYQAQGKTQISTVRAGYGAADLIGASAQALAQAIDYQTTQALEATRFNYAVSFDNYMTDIEATSQQGVNSLQRTVNAAPQQPMDIYGMFKAGNSMYDGYKAMNQQGGFNAGLQFGSGTPQSASNNPMPSSYSLPSNVNLQFKGF